MSGLFLKIVNMSIASSWLVLAVLALRLVLHKAPKWVSVLLWGLVAVRLICPVSLESSLSLIPQSVGSGELVANWADDYVGDVNIHHENSIYYDAAVTAGRDPISDGQGGYYVVTKSDQLGEPSTVENTVIPVLSVVWALGIFLMLAYTAVSYWRLHRKTRTAVLLRGNIFQSERVGSPFVLGVIRPKIYLPFGMDARDQEHVIAHERAHIRRKDHWWKPLGFLLLTVHWFNPLMWLACALLCRDIELACDERVVRELGDEQRVDYSQALLSCSVPHRMIAACPLAFGEVGVKERVKSVLSYKRPAFWIIVLAVAVCVAVAVCFLTNPVGSSGEPDLSFLNYENAIPLVADREEITAIYCPSTDSSTDGLIQMGVASGAELAKYLDQWDWKPCNAPRQRLSSPGSVEFVIEEDHRITVYQRKSMSLRQYAVVQFQGEERYYSIDRNDYPDAVSMVTAPPRPSGDEAAAAVEWFNYLETPDEMPWDGRREINIPEFPDVIFRWEPEKMEAVNENGTTLLFQGMPIWNAYFCDITGDGLPELCSTLSIGSGIIDSRITAFDYANGVSYELEERGEYDYILSLRDDSLVVTRYMYPVQEAVETGTLACENDVLRMVNTAPISTQDPLQAAILSAILEQNDPGKPDGLYHCASFVELDRRELSGTAPVTNAAAGKHLVTVYGLALHQSYGFAGSAFRNVGGSHIPVAITFEARDGEYILSEYWTPQDGSYYEPDIREKFPDEIEDNAMDTQKYILSQVQNCYDQAVRYGEVDTDSVIENLFEVIESSPAAASDPAAYIEAHPIEYRELTYYGAYTLRYCFRQFIEGDQTDLRGQLMASVCDEIALGWGEVPSVNEPATGQEWFDIFRAIAGQLAEQYGADEMAALYPASWLLVQMLPQDAEAASTSQAVRHDLTTGDLEVPVGELANYVFYTNSEQISVTVKSDMDFEGKVNLLDSSQNNAQIQQAAVNTHEEDCLFTNLTAARLYSVACDGLEDCTAVISGGD